MLRIIAIKLDNILQVIRVLWLPLQAVSGNGSPWKRPSKCCRATNLYTPSTCGGSSSAALPPMATASSQARHQTTSTPTTARTPRRPRRGTCWARPADRTALRRFKLGQFTPKSVQSLCMNLLTSQSRGSPVFKTSNRRLTKAIDGTL